MLKCLFIIVIVLIMGSLVMCGKPDPASYWITNKYEYNGHYYVDIQVEISADDYIGYDIGDEYIMNY